MTDDTRDAGAPDVPDRVDWERYVWYQCAGCGWPCINREDSEAAEADRCWSCATDSRTLRDGRLSANQPEQVWNTR